MSDYEVKVKQFIEGNKDGIKAAIQQASSEGTAIAVMGYSLCLMSSLSGSDDNPYEGAKKNRIYIDQDSRKYVVLGEEENRSQGTLPNEIDLSQLSLNPEDRDLRNQVLSYILNASEIEEARRPLESADNWLGEDPLPRYIVFKSDQDKNEYGIIIVENALGIGATGSVFESAILSGDLEDPNNIHPNVIKAVGPLYKVDLEHEIQFSTEDVCHSDTIIPVGKISTAFFEHIPGKKLVSQIEDNGIDVKPALLNLNFEDRCQLMIDLCSKLEKMHTGYGEKRPFCHLDLNFDNVLVQIDEKDDRYKACRIIDHGQSEFLNGAKLKEGKRIGKIFWNPLEANQLMAKGDTYTFVPGAKTDMVPLGAMGDIIFAARKGFSSEEYNPFLRKQEAYQGVDFKGAAAIRAVSNAPFVIHDDFINPEEWHLKVANAERLNELMKVFFERMVSDYPEDRPSAAEAKQFFTNIKALYALNKNENLGNGNLANERILLEQCDEFVFHDNLLKSADAPNSPLVIRQLQRLLCSPEYSESREDAFYQEKINLLIKVIETGEDKEGVHHNVGVLYELLRIVSLMDKDIGSSRKKQAKAHFVAVFMKASIWYREMTQFQSLEMDFYEKYKGITEENLEANIEELLKTLNENDLYKRYASGEKINPEDNPGFDDMLEKLAELNEKTFFLNQNKIFAHDMKALKKEIEDALGTVRKSFGDTIYEDANSSLPFRVLLTEYGAKGFLVSNVARVGAAETFIVTDGGWTDQENEAEEVSSELNSKNENEESIAEQYNNALQRYQRYLDAYKLVLKSLKHYKESGNDNSGEILIDQEPADIEDDPVLVSNRAFLTAVKEKKCLDNQRELVTVLNYQANTLRNLVEVMDPNKENENKLKLAEPVLCTDKQYVGAMRKLETQGKTDLVALGLMSLGIILGLTMAVTATIGITLLLGVTCPPLLLALPVLGPMVASAAAAPMYLAATCAISTLGCVATVALAIKKQKYSEKAWPREMAKADQLVRGTLNVASNPYLFRPCPQKPIENEKYTQASKATFNHQH